MANGGTNGHDPSRLDRLEGLVEVLLNRHIEFEDEHKRLLIAQVVLTDRIDRMAKQDLDLREQVTRNAEQMRQTDDKLNALIEVVGLVRKRLPG
jgi:hypothetical protein